MLSLSLVHFLCPFPLSWFLLHSLFSLPSSCAAVHSFIFRMISYLLLSNLSPFYIVCISPNPFSFFTWFLISSSLSKSSLLSIFFPFLTTHLSEREEY